MSTESPNQAVLHKERQSQLLNSVSYTQEFIANLDPSLDYVNVACPTCGHKSVDYLFEKNGGRYVYCPQCEHVFLGNQLISQKLLNFYSGYPTNTLEWHLNESEFYHRIYSKGLDLINKNSDNCKVLDIGCSSGFFLSIAQKLGMDAFGIEPNQLEAAYAQRNGINVLGSSISSLDHNQSFDLITLWDVLEHIPNPVDYIQSLIKYLNPNGLIFVQVPSSDSLAAKIMREHCNMFDGVEHLTLFSKRSLNIAFSAAGLELAAYGTVISEAYAINNFLAYSQDPYITEASNRILDSLLGPEAIEASGLGYKMQAVYQLKK